MTRHAFTECRASINESWGDSFDSLDPILKRIHDGRRIKRYSGLCDIQVDSTVLATLVAKVVGLPSKSKNVAITVTMSRKDACEEWTRQFGALRMRSSLRIHRGKLCERLGFAVFTFDLIAKSDRIDWRFASARLWPIPIPITSLIQCSASEAVVDERCTFDVTARVRGVGMIVHYRGWLVES